MRCLLFAEWKKGFRTDSKTPIFCLMAVLLLVARGSRTIQLNPLSPLAGLPVNGKAGQLKFRVILCSPGSHARHASKARRPGQCSLW